MAVQTTRSISVDGLDKINRSLKTFIAMNEKGAFLGIQKATVFIKGESQEITPHKFGVLVGSAFSSTDRNSLTGRIGYTAKYAPFVHDMPDPTINNAGGATGFFVKVRPVNWTKAGTGNKFLKKAINNNFQAVLNIIAKKTQLTPQNYRGFNRA